MGKLTKDQSEKLIVYVANLYGSGESEDKIFTRTLAFANGYLAGEDIPFEKVYAEVCSIIAVVRTYFIEEE